MLFPTDLLPSALGLRWGMGKHECLKVLGAIPNREHMLWALVTVCIREEPYELELQYDERDRLERIRVGLYESRSFWDDDPPWDTEEMQALWRQADMLYHRLIEQYSALLGPAAYSGAWGEPGYPEDETSTLLTYWTYHGNRLKLISDQPDTEFPIVVVLESQPISDID